MRSVGSVTGCVNVTSARPSTGETSSSRDLGDIADDFFHPQIPDDEILEPHRRAEQS
jgi:hypothetical protein